MNTLIELYDKEPIENIYAALAFRPEQVVFLGDSRLMTRERQEHLKLFFKQQQLKTKLFFYPLRGEDTQQIERTFLQVAERFPDGVVDVTGGTDLLLVTAGKLCERAEMPVIFFNVRTGELVPLGKKTGLGDFSAPALTVQSLLTLAGGAYLRHGHYTPELENPQVKQEILAVWDLIAADMEGWSRQSAYFQQAARPGELEVHAPVHIQVNFKNMVHSQPRFMKRLSEIGVIQDYRMTNGRVHYRYKNEMYQRLLSDTGVWLELYTYYTAKSSGLFDDVQTSVIIDWDGREKENYNTINEIDDILVKGIVPLFVSCKMGVPSVLAVTEIEMLARRFGGALAKPVLVTASRVSELAPFTAARARDMGVTILEIQQMDDRNFLERLAAVSNIDHLPLTRDGNVRRF